MKSGYPNISFLRLISLVSLSAVISCNSNKESANSPKGPKPGALRVEGYVVRAEVFRNDYSASGTLRPNEEVDIHPDMPGRIVAIHFREGSNVRKGQPLVQLYDADIRAQLQKLLAQKALQQKMLERQDELLRIGGISRQDYETTQTQIASIDADIAFQQAQLRKARILAPFDGRLGLRDVSVGAVVSQATVVAQLQQVRPLKMDFTVPDQYRDAISPGKTVFFTIEAENTPLSGKVSAVDPGADVNTRSIRVRAIVPNADGKLTPGAFAHVTVPLESKVNALLVPSQAVIPTTRDKKLAIVRNGKADIITVQLGTRSSDMVEVTSGLVSGDTVITTGIMQVKPGMGVTITRMKR